MNAFASSSQLRMVTFVSCRRHIDGFDESMRHVRPDAVHSLVGNGLSFPVTPLRRFAAGHLEFPLGSPPSGNVAAPRVGAGNRSSRRPHLFIGEINPSPRFWTCSPGRTRQAPDWSRVSRTDGLALGTLEPHPRTPAGRRRREVLGFASSRIVGDRRRLADLRGVEQCWLDRCRSGR